MLIHVGPSGGDCRGVTASEVSEVDRYKMEESPVLDEAIGNKNRL